MKWIPSACLFLALPFPAPPPPLVGRPCLFNDYLPEGRCFPAILRDRKGVLTCGRLRLNRGGATPAPPAAGPVCPTPFRLPDGGGQEWHFAYRDWAGGIQDLRSRREGEREFWEVQTLNEGGVTSAPAAYGNPSGIQEGGVYRVVYQDERGRVVEVAREGGWAFRFVGQEAGGEEAPRAGGDPVQAWFEGRRHVLYRDRKGGLQDFWRDRGWKSRTLNLGGLTPAPPAAGEPAVVEHQGILHVVYRDGEGALVDLLRDGGWQVRRLNRGGLTDAPLAQGDPSVASVGDRLRVIYRDPEGGLQSLTWGTSWEARVLNGAGETSAPLAASDPCLMVPPSRWEYIAYVDGKGRGQMLVRPWQKGWAAVPLDASTPPGAPGVLDGKLTSH